MRLLARDVMRRAIERGYTPDEIRQCFVADLGNGWWEVDVNHKDYPKTHKTEAITPGLGDMVAAGLESIGITKHRVSAITTAITGKPCRCGERQEMINKLGRRVGIGIESTPG